MLCDLVRTFTADGLRLDGALQVPGGDSRSADELRVDAFVTLHGVASNFYGSSLFDALTPRLLASGIAVLWANTRGHDTLFPASLGMRGRGWMGGAVERVGDCPLDVAAWLNYLAERGYRRLGIVGHSLGAIKAVYSQAQQADERVHALIALSPPRLSYSAFLHDPRAAEFRAAVDAAQQAVRDGKANQLLEVGFPFRQWMAAATYLEKYGPDENYNVLRYVDRLKCPACFAYGGREIEDGGLAFAGMPDAVLAAKRPAQPLDVAVIPDGDHNYAGVARQLADKLLEWLHL